VPVLPRDEFPVVDRYIYFDHAGIAPITRGAAEAASWWAQRTTQFGRENYDEVDERMERARATASALMGVDPVDVAFVKNTTEGMGFVASGLTWREGDRVVVPDDEFPSTIFPWLSLRALGVRVDRVAPEGDAGALPVEAFERVIASGPPPKVVVTSWVQYGRGWRTDIERLARVAHDAGSLICVDVMQGIGVLPAELSAWNIDFAMAAAHKWMCGPQGIGVLHVASRVRDRLRPLEPGWASVAHRGDWGNLDFVLDDSARRFEGGTPNAVGIVALDASLQLIKRAGINNIWEAVNQLCTRLANGLSMVDGAHVLCDRSPDSRSGIVSFVLDTMQPADVTKRLLERGILCSPRGGGVRVSPHAYNTEDEIDRFVEAAAELAQP
jgi:selenocysteine lyase/cysteine desulfurase